MVNVRVTRQAIEALFEAPIRVRMVRQEMEVLFDPGTGSGAVQVPRQAIEVLLQVFDRVSLYRQEMEVLFEPGSGSGTVYVPRQAIEVLSESPTIVELNRQEMEVLFQPASGTGAVQVPRQGVEILLRRGIPAPTPLPLPDGIDFFTHNWDTELELETNWSTDVTASATTLAEERRQLWQKPQRIVVARWLQSGIDELDRLYINLRKLCERRGVLPLYPDNVTTNADSLIATNTIYCDTRYRRFFAGARVLVVPKALAFLIPNAQSRFFTIHEVYPDRLVVVEALDATLPSGAYRVCPLVDVEQGLSVKFGQPHYGAVDVRVQGEEVVGASTLPPIQSGQPEGYDTFDGDPIFNLEPNWNDLQFGFHRDGIKQRLGRADYVYNRGTRAGRVTPHDFVFGTRAEAWHFLRFWESRKGRLLPFWLADQEKLWTLLQVQPNFVSVMPLGNFDDFAEGFEHVAIVKKDGTTIIRQVNTIQEVLGVWKLTTVGDAMPAVDPADVLRITRARRHRWESDSLREHWHNELVMTCNLTSVEVFREGEHTL